MRIGILAPEFPPAVGGMHTLAYGMAGALSATDDVTVFTRARAALPEKAPFRVAPVLTEALAADTAALRLREGDVDVWLLLNGGLMPIAPQLHRPSFVYLHGNDFLKPWIGYGSWWMERIRKPYMADIRHAVRRAAMRRTVAVARHLLARHLFTNSARTAELAAESLRITRERFSVCPPGVDDRFFQAHDDRNGDTLRLLTVTRLTKYTARKNVDGVLAAVAKLRGRIRMRYTVVGDGDDRERLQALARELGIGDTVEFAGSLAADALLARYRAADLFVLASKATRDDVEGFGIVYLEASAAGVPVMCSREGGAVDAVEAGTNGIVLSSSSPDAIAAGIVEFVAHRSRYAPAAVRAFAESFRWPRTVAPLRAKLYESVGGARPSSAAAERTGVARRASVTSPMEAPTP
jgi:glycosyltransferase involved in cell wall biosynthesis